MISTSFVRIGTCLMAKYPQNLSRLTNGLLVRGYNLGSPLWFFTGTVLRSFFMSRSCHFFPKILTPHYQTVPVVLPAHRRAFNFHHHESWYHLMAWQCGAPAVISRMFIGLLFHIEWRLCRFFFCRAAVPVEDESPCSLAYTMRSTVQIW